MARWFTADLHLGHRNIIGYCRRPFADVDAMNAALVDRWNERVGKGDEVIVLGDVAMGRIDESLQLIGDLRGRKALLAGNHDRCWAGHRKGVDAATARYRAAGFDEIWQGTVTLDLGGTTVLACHFPYQGDSHGRDRFVRHRPVDRGLWLLHGHVHDRWTVRDRMINVGVDAWDYAPVPQRTLAAIVAAG
jgi:calcineurin-like phosphoesterase family protein